MKITSLQNFTGLIFLAATVALTGCTTTGDGGRNQQAMVCPKCKTVAVRTVQPSGNAQAGWTGNLRPTTVYEHQCPGCQGAMKTFFREGEWKHKCSVCKDTPYTCPVIHP